MVIRSLCFLRKERKKERKRHLFLYLARKKRQRSKLHLLSVRQVDWKVHSNKFQRIIGVLEFYQMILQIRICNGRNKHGVKIQQDEGRKSIVVQGTGTGMGLQLDGQLSREYLTIHHVIQFSEQRRASIKSVIRFEYSIIRVGTKQRGFRDNALICKAVYDEKKLCD